jgi:hypothetical protein
VELEFWRKHLDAFIRLWRTHRTQFFCSKEFMPAFISYQTFTGVSTSIGMSPHFVWSALREVTTLPSAVCFCSSQRVPWWPPAPGLACKTRQGITRADSWLIFHVVALRSVTCHAPPLSRLPSLVSNIVAPPIRAVFLLLFLIFSIQIFRSPKLVPLSPNRNGSGVIKSKFFILARKQRSCFFGLDIFVQTKQFVGVVALL